ncbi:MAG: diaminopropionate ammonia-lyase [Alphaproteobacteria bacterium]|nr:diaminopropionate ammonia-lyase [Alphaproteobacteria bacterium]
MIAPLPFSLFVNPRAGTPGIVVLPAAGFRRAKAAITGWPEYAPTPLRDLPEIARGAGVAAVRLKDEAGRFGLGSFKALGGAYAVAEALRGQHKPEAVTVTCATDGNHGRAVAWGARRCGCRCVVFVHEAVSAGRAAAIAALGAELRRVPGTYDDAVREAERVAQQEGWSVISDTSWPGYLEVPRRVMQGYRLMADEALEQWDGAAPSHVFIQAGVGGVAAAVAVQLRARLTPPPALIVVEPDRAACLLASAELGAPTSVPGTLDTVMAGLACGEPSLLAWQELDRSAAAFMAIPDEAAPPAMRLLADAGIVTGESGAAGLAALRLAAADPAARAALGLGAESRVLLFGTEGATDPAVYERLVGRPADTVARKST